MLQLIIYLAYSAVLLVASFMYLAYRYPAKVEEKEEENKEEKKEEEKKESFWKKNIKVLIATVVALAALLVITSPYVYKNDFDHLMTPMRWVTIYWGTFLCAVVDIREKKIPNKIVAALFLILLVFIIFNLFQDFSMWKSILGVTALGALIGGGIMFVAMVISRKGVGMGDVKMYLAIGAYVGSREIINTMFFAIFSAAIAGAVLLLTRKASLKDSVPMAPFAFFGVAAVFLLRVRGLM